MSLTKADLAETLKSIVDRLDGLESRMMFQFNYLIQEIHRIEDGRPRSSEPQTLDDLKAMNPEAMKRWFIENFKT